jgi:hypothetical protein
VSGLDGSLFQQIWNVYTASGDEFDDAKHALLAVVEARIQQSRREAWDEGYDAGLDDFAGDVKRTPNPYAEAPA